MTQSEAQSLFFLHQDDDKPKEECGVFGIIGHPDASAHVALGLHALQHRGQEAAGIASYDGVQCYAHRALGLVGDNFNSADIIGRLKGYLAIGHVRYSTTGDTLLTWVPALHAGAFGGTPVKIIYGLLGLVFPLLFLTGFIMWWLRVIRKQLQNYADAAAKEATSASAPSRV